MKQIDKIHTQFPYMGSRKIVIKLKENGYNICRKTVRRLMQKMGIYAIYPKPNLSKRNSKEAVVPYLLRNYDARFPNQVWSIDIIYLPMNRSHMYLTAIIDWHSRKIVGHYLSDTLDASSVILAVKEAISQHGVPAIINSDPRKGVKGFRHIEPRHLVNLLIAGIFHSELNNQYSNEYGLHYNRLYIQKRSSLHRCNSSDWYPAFPF